MTNQTRTEPHPFERGGLLSTTCARPECLQAPTARIHSATRTEPLDRLAELEQAATPGPWTTAYGGQNWWIASCGMGEEDMTVWSPIAPTEDMGGERKDDGGEADRRNAAFIAALRNAAPSLIAETREAARLRTAGQHMYGVLSRMTVIDQRAPIGNFISAINQALDEGAVFVREEAVKP